MHSLMLPWQSCVFVCVGGGGGVEQVWGGGGQGGKHRVFVRHGQQSMQ
jgi:hypothetical protein